MHTSTRATRTRRHVVIAATTLALAAAAAAALRPAPLVARSPDAPAGHPTASPPDWLAGITAEHRQLFDMTAPNDGIPLIHILNYYDTYNRAYGEQDVEVDAVGTLYGGITLYGVNDAMWEKYGIGELLKVNDPATGKPAVTNPWRANPVVLGMSMPQASVESLQRRGATFILCDNALGFFSGVIARARGLDADSVHADLKANALPGVILVPGMVVAIEQAHDAGLSYMRQ
ncbi:MAG TPA: hypothetical protein VGE02_01630 [Gemmatimonadales bacterium]